MIDVLLIPFFERFFLIKYFRGFSLPNDIPKVIQLIDEYSQRPSFKSVAYFPSDLVKMLKEKLPRLPPFSAPVLQHSVMRKILTQIDARAKENKIDLLKRAVRSFREVYIMHGQFEDKFLFAEAEKQKAGVTKTVAEQHQELDKLLDSLDTVFQKNEINIQEIVSKFVAANLAHLDEEEKSISPVFKDLPADHQFSVLSQAKTMNDKLILNALPIIFDYLQPHERDHYMYVLHNTFKSDPQYYKMLINIIKSESEPATWSSISDRVPEYIPPSLLVI